MTVFRHDQDYATPPPPGLDGVAVRFYRSLDEEHRASLNGVAMTTHLGAVMPSIVIRPTIPAPDALTQAVRDRLDNAVRFESEDFNAFFTVQCDYPRFAYEVCHAAMMAWLLDRWNGLSCYKLVFEIAQDTLIGHAMPYVVENLVDEVKLFVGFRKQLPGFFGTKYAEEPMSRDR